MSIKVLPAEISNQIAAGEVVERPASVLKECVENSLDADAKHIEIFLDKGGKARLKIVDDGAGISAEDLPKAVLRHATSKISSSEDLFALQQYGFRGEALAAVSSVSDFTLVSKTVHMPEPMALKGSAGKFEPVSAVPGNDGTTVIIENLFHPVPARLEYLKSDEAEYRACLKELYGFALANPNVSFTLFKADQKSLDYPATSLEQRVRQVLKSQANDLCAVDFETPSLKITGFISEPGRGLSHKNQQYLLVNGRRIEDHRLAFAVREGYVQSAGIEKHLHPAFVLSLELDPILVDVNVHPRKLEVKFAEPGEVFSVVKAATIKALEAVTFTPQTSTSVVQTAPTSFSPNQSHTPKFNFTPHRVSTPVLKPHSHRFQAPSFSERHESRELCPTGNVAPQLEEEIRLIGQAQNKYIVAQSDRGLYFFDQHALHERLRFDVLWREYKAKPLKSQSLLVVEPLKMPEVDVSLLHQHSPILNDLAFEISFVKDDEIVVSAVPEALVGQDLANLMQQCVEYLQNEKIGEHVLDQIMRKLLEYKSCRGSVMFGDKMKPEEMQKLLDDFHQSDWKLLCPHGRPNFHFIPFSEFDTWFHR